MGLLSIRKYGDPVLRKACDPVREITPDIRRLVRDMLETMYDAPGSGLAAPQVGIPLRLCVIDARPGGRRQPLVLINPRIVSAKTKVEMDEGCLSIPGVMMTVRRFLHVRAEALDARGFPYGVEGEDLLAQALQHEIDHLDGRLYVDRLAPSKRRDAVRMIEKEMKRW